MKKKFKLFSLLTLLSFSILNSDIEQNDSEFDDTNLISLEDLPTKALKSNCGKIRYFDKVVVRDFIKVGTLDAAKICLSGSTGGRGNSTVPGPTGATGATGSRGLRGATGPTGNAGQAGVTGATGPAGSAGTNTLVFTVGDMNNAVSDVPVTDLNVTLTYMPVTLGAPPTLTTIYAKKMLSPVSPLGIVINDPAPISLVFQIPNDYAAGTPFNIGLNFALDSIGSIGITGLLNPVANVRASADFQSTNAVLSSGDTFKSQVETGAFPVVSPGIPNLRYLEMNVILPGTTALPGQWAIFVFDRIPATNPASLLEALYIGLSNVNVTYTRS